MPDGHRLHVVLDGISRDFVAVNIRKFVVRATRLSELADLGSLTPQAAQFLEGSVVADLNIVVSGATQAGKTTMLNCLGKLFDLPQSFDRNGTVATVERQRQDCEKLCADRGGTVAREFCDNDTSTSSSKPRPAYTAMLAAVERGEAEVICARHIDRLTRKLIELEHLVDLAQRTNRAHRHSDRRPRPCHLRRPYPRVRCQGRGRA